jgi:hypothetical protein
MPFLNPTDPHSPTPRGWRTPYDDFRKLRAIASAAGIDTTTWGINVPGTKDRILGKTWQLIYTPIGERTATSVSLGQDAYEATGIIKQLFRAYSQYIDSQGGFIRHDKPKASGPAKPTNVVGLDSIYDPGYAKKFMDLVKQGRIDRIPRQILSQQAGVLPMSVRDYLSRSPMSILWPSPPRTDKELRTRLEYLEQREKENAKVKEVEKATNYDPGPGWAYEQ